MFVHVHYHHSKEIENIGAQNIYITCFEHFYAFVREFDLIAPKELRPLAENRPLGDAAKR